MAVDPDRPPNLSWKDKLLGGVAVVSDLNRFGPSTGIENKFELLEGDVNTPMIDGIHAIALSDRIKEILFKEMELTVVLKLLTRNIGYNAINNLSTSTLRSCARWWAIKPRKKDEIAVVTFTSGVVGEGESAKRPEFGL
ncbi:hypothetical protein PVK06_035931 [Gossypium arboreum]|uniref:Uncharacterized protein n=1 Tax=Gossypium arboreum TaxID=29729 RepID=A0ABR0NI38_GOSAR|nr:hypothetical protein PVK06_035931 [Gossypium arboreum]